MRNKDRILLLDAITDLCKEAASLAVREANSCRGCCVVDDTEFSAAQTDLLKVMEEIGI